MCIGIFSPLRLSASACTKVSSTEYMFALLRKVENQVIICGPMKILKSIWESSQMAKEIK